MDKYILLRPDEDGNIITFIQEEEVQNIMELMDYYGVEKWITKFDDEHGQDVQYWKEGEAMLLEIKIKKPKIVEVVKKYELD